MTALECLECELYEERNNDRAFGYCNHYDDCINKYYQGYCHCTEYWGNDIFDMSKEELYGLIDEMSEIIAENTREINSLKALLESAQGYCDIWRKRCNELDEKLFDALPKGD